MFTLDIFSAKLTSFAGIQKLSIGFLHTYICHGHHRRCPWRKNLPCGEISPHDILLLEEILHMTDWHVEKVLHVRNVNKICKLDTWCMQFMVFCRIKLLKNQVFGDLRCFVEIFLLWFTRFCVEKNWAKNCVCGEKRTNIVYALHFSLFCHQQSWEMS